MNSFLRALLAGAAVTALSAPALAQAPKSRSPSAALLQGFANPPAAARPRVWWHWMNGNITKEGIRKDIEWMSRVGIGGLQNFDAALATPQIVDRRLVYMTPEWKDAFRYAAGLANQHGLEMTVAASPGWSETGGPWVAPRDGMKKLVWSETVVVAGSSSGIRPARPSDVTGPFQDIPRNRNFAAAETGEPDPAFYADVGVFAFPLPDGETFTPALSTGEGTAIAAAPLLDGRFQTSVDVPSGTAQSPGVIVADFGQPRRVRAVSLALARSAAMFQGAAVRPRLEVEDGAGGWRKVVDMSLDAGIQTTAAFEPVTARRFRIVFLPAPPNPPDFLGSVPGAVLRPLFQEDRGATLSVSELRFTDEERIDRFEVKAGFGISESYYGLTTTADPRASGIDPARVIDLTGKLSPDGTLDWSPPLGRWKVLRLGYSLVGTTNHPAPVEATGLEVDKFDGAAVRRYMETYIANLRGAAGPALIGGQGLRAVLTDSIEVGASNWTPDLIAQFRRLRGYDPRPWLPALTGVIVGSRADSDRFLYDFRATLADLMSSQHYGQVAETAHAHGLKVYGESLESGRPTLGDDLTMRSHADVPMAALWTYDRAKGPRLGLLGDMKGASSVAHVYGQNIAAAESLTAAFSPWAFAPKDLRPVVDLEFAYGINRPVIHTSVHQPVDDKVPGLSLGPFGQYFNRHDTWAEMARPWVDYISRTAFMLQLGRNLADVAYFYGEEQPVTVLYADRSLKDLPQHYAFDFVNRDMLQNALSVSGGELVARGGARYRVLYLGGSSRRMTLPTLNRIAALAEAGATIVGMPPESSPSLPDKAEEISSLVKRLWSGRDVTVVGKGRVIAAASAEEALGSLGVKPDFAAGAPASDLLFVHRRLPDADIYFLTNRTAAALKTEARFRVSGRAAEIWRADTGGREAASYRIDKGETIVPLELAADESLFVVFRTPTSKASFRAPQPEVRRIAGVEGAWDVTFQTGRGAPPSLSLPKLAPLSEHADPGVKYFSGVATYTKTFTVPQRSGTGRLLLDLGAVGDVAEVHVNGKSAGIAWKPPYRVDITALARPGENRLEVRVADLWVNRLIGDAQPGASKVAYTTDPTYLPEAPLRPSGLIGPVTLLSGAR